MNRSKLLLASLATLNSLALLPATYCHAQEETPDTSMAQYQFSGVVNTDNVEIRSGASEIDYPVMKLSKGDPLVVVGIKGDWLKVIPPENTQFFIGKVWVDRRGDGTVGRVRDDSTNANVRVGSNLNEMKNKVVSQMKPGEDVKIMKETDQYFQIAAPVNAFVYVPRKFVDAVKRVEVIADGGKLVIKQSDSPTNKKETSLAGSPKLPPGTLVDIYPNEAARNGTGPTTQSSDVATGSPTTSPAIAANPTTAPVDTASLQAFQSLEADFTEASKLPLEKQPIDRLLNSYSKVVAADDLGEPIQRLAKYRLSGLELRRDALAHFQESKKTTDALAARQMPLAAEATEIDQRMKQNQVRTFAAIGTIRISSIYHNGKPLYRLTDPATGRTVVYVASGDDRMASMEGSFVGMRGTVADDRVKQIKVISPQDVETLDPNDIGSGRVSAVLMPTSLAARAGTSGF